FAGSRFRFVRFFFFSPVALVFGWTRTVCFVLAIASSRTRTFEIMRLFWSGSALAASLHTGPPPAQLPSISSIAFQPHSGLPSVFIFPNFFGVMRPAILRKSFLDVIQLRERAHRLLRRRISPLVQNYVGNDLRSDLIQFCTENTFHHCILFISYLVPLVQSPGGYLFHFWLLLSSGPVWVLKMLKESFEGLLPIGNRILNIFCQAKRPVHPNVMALLLQMR